MPMRLELNCGSYPSHVPNSTPISVYMQPIRATKHRRIDKPKKAFILIKLSTYTIEKQKTNKLMFVSEGINGD